MLRIDEVTNSQAGALTLRLEGKLVGKWVEELRQAAGAARERDSGPLTIDLAGLSYADQAGTALLGRLAGRGVRLTNCSQFAAAQLRDAHIECRME